MSVVQTVISGLGTSNIGVQDAGTYKIKGSITLPSITEGSLTNSLVVATISVNGGGAIYTGLPGSEGFEITTVLPASCFVNITLSSSAPVDLGLNIIKATVSIA